MKKRFLVVLAISLSAMTLSLYNSSSANAQDAPAKPPAPSQPTPPTPGQPDKPGAADTRINGKWHFVFDTPGGDRDFEAEFTVDADGKVTGTWDKKPASGTYKDGHLQMAFDTFSEEANETATLTLDGKMDDAATITGSWSFSSYNGAFKATHPKV